MQFKIWWEYSTAGITDVVLAPEDVRDLDAGAIAALVEERFKIEVDIDNDAQSTTGMIIRAIERVTDCVS